MTGAGARALNRSNLRDMLEDDRVWCVLGTVALHDGETGHYEVNEDGDIQVTVVAHQHGTPITAILGGSFGSAAGAWTVPAAGDEVLVCFPDGEFEGDAVVVAVTSSRSAPAGLVPGKVFVLGDEVVVKHEGTAAALATKADIDAIWRWLYAQFASTGGHTHSTPSGPTVTTTAVAPVAAPAPPSPVPPSVIPPEPDGTTVLKAE